jgi:hypothetical protein
MIQSKNKSGPQARPSKYLQAIRDFSVFQFTSIYSQNPVTRQVRFICQPGGHIYSLDVRNFRYQKDAIPISKQTKEDFNGELATLIQIIEIYSDRYPDRAIRLGGENHENFQLYQAAIEKYLDKINSLFLFEIEERGVFSETSGNKITVSLLLKRKPIPYLNLSTIRTLWNSQSRLFGKNVTVEFSKAITLRGCVPGGLSSSENSI